MLSCNVTEAILNVPEAILDVPEAILDVPEAIMDVPEAILKRLYWSHLTIVPLCGPSCNLRLAKFSARLKFQDESSVAIILSKIRLIVCKRTRHCNAEKDKLF